MQIIGNCDPVSHLNASTVTWQQRQQIAQKVILYEKLKRPPKLFDTKLIPRTRGVRIRMNSHLYWAKEPIFNGDTPFYPIIKILTTILICCDEFNFGQKGVSPM